MGDGYGHTSKRRCVKRSLVFVNKNSCASSTLSHLTHLRRLAPEFAHIEPSPIVPSPLFVARLRKGAPEARFARKPANPPLQTPPPFALQRQKCTSKGLRRQGLVLKRRSSEQKSLCPVVVGLCLCSSDSGVLQENAVEPAVVRLAHRRLDADLAARCRIYIYIYIYI